MKKRNVFLGALAIALALAMAFAGCSKGANSGAKSGGTLTITNIPSKYNNGAVVILQAQDREGTFLLNMHPFKTVNAVSNGKVVIPLGKYDKEHAAIPDDYSGNDTLDVAIVFRTSDSAAIAQGVFQAVKFSKGSATKSWKDAVIEEKKN